MKPIRIDVGNIHQSQLPAPPKEVVEEAIKIFGFPSEEIAVLALKSWHVVCIFNGWAPNREPSYVIAHTMFMNGFAAGYNCHVQKSREIAESN